VAEANDEDLTIRADELRPGDILLCVFQPAGGLLYYLELIEQLIVDLSTPGKQLDYQDYLDLVKLLISLFDQDRYYHAAYWNGAKVFEEHSKDGLGAHDLDTYRDELTEVVRYVSDDGTELGSPGLSAEPVQRQARALYDELHPSGARGYSKWNCGLLLALCVVRMSRTQMVDAFEGWLRAQIERDLPEWTKPAVGEALDRLFSADNKALLADRLTEYATFVLRLFQDNDAMVCSQFVAHAYAGANDGTGYVIAKPTTPVLATTSAALLALPGTGGLGDGDLEGVLVELAGSLERLPPPPLSAPAPSVPLEQWAGIDDLYTPSDLSRSRNTRFMGRLQLA